MKKQFYLLWRENKSFFIFVVLMMLFRSALADWNTVPTGSMKPTIIEGDRIAVNKIAYDLRIPFTHISLITLANPERGDIVVFDSKAADKRLVKRVIGLPGDTIAMSNNQLIINDQLISYATITNESSEVASQHIDKIEHLFNTDHSVRLSDLNNHHFANFPPVQVPEGHYLMLGDNRDNSADSRVIGFVPRNEIIGRTRNVVMSFNYDNYYLPRADRYLEALN
ncbi:MAG: signal peptidase I [Pseudomonadota bacterium]